MARQQYTGVDQVVADAALAPLTDAQIGELFRSGWRFNPGSKTWHKLFLADDGADETPAVIHDALSRGT